MQNSMFMKLIKIVLPLICEAIVLLDTYLFIILYYNIIFTKYTLIPE